MRNFFKANTCAKAHNSTSLQLVGDSLAQRFNCGKNSKAETKQYLLKSIVLKMCNKTLFSKKKQGEFLLHSVGFSSARAII